MGEILDRTNEIAREVAAPRAFEVDQQGIWPKHTLDALQAEGLGGMTVPEEYDGLGQGSYGLTLVCEILGQECASSAMCFGMHCVGSAVLSAKATNDQQQRYLQPIVAGKHLTTLSLSEPGTGSHFYIPHTKLEEISSNDFVTNGSYADSYVFSARTGQETAESMGQFSCVVVPGHANGLVWGGPWEGLGMRGNSSRSLELNGVLVSRDDLLGEQGDQIWYVFKVVAPFFLMAMAGTYLGIANSALEEARSHLYRRHFDVSGSSLGEISVIQHRLGSLWAQLERTRRLIYHAAGSFDSGNPDALPAVFSAKAEAADCAVDIVNEVMTLTGGIAYRNGSKLHQLLRDARAAHVMAPTTDMLRTWTGRVLLGKPILGM